MFIFWYKMLILLSSHILSADSCLLCVFGFGFVVFPRGPEERQRRPPGTCEEGGGGSERQAAESCVLRPAAPAHQLTAQGDCSRGSRVT